jgi:hypothetical protein
MAFMGRDNKQSFSSVFFLLLVLYMTHFVHATHLSLSAIGCIDFPPIFIFLGT